MKTDILSRSYHNRILAFYEHLLSHYGEQHWWPCRRNDRWEIVSGAILTQNCAWRNVEKALLNLEKTNIVTPQNIIDAEDKILCDAIRPAGFFNQKSLYLKTMAEFFIENEKEYLISDDICNLRNRLLALKGTGRETADAILLYAFGKPIFVIDSYTRRAASRHLGIDGTIHYDKLQKIFMDALPRDVKIFNEYHALIVALAKESCKKSSCGDLCSKLEHKIQGFTK